MAKKKKDADVSTIVYSKTALAFMEEKFGVCLPALFEALAKDPATVAEHINNMSSTLVDMRMKLDEEITALMAQRDSVNDELCSLGKALSMLERGLEKDWRILK